MNDNTENLFINIELYTALMDIRDRFQKEIANYELQQRKMNSPYAKVLKKRETEMESIRKKYEEQKDIPNSNTQERSFQNERTNQKTC
jgi:hypothetical protein